MHESADAMSNGDDTGAEMPYHQLLIHALALVPSWLCVRTRYVRRRHGRMVDKCSTERPMYDLNSIAAMIFSRSHRKYMEDQHNVCGSGTCMDKRFLEEVNRITPSFGHIITTVGPRLTRLELDIRFVWRHRPDTTDLTALRECA